MDRRRWLQYERSERPTNQHLPGAASRRPNGSAEREIPFLSNKENGENRRWPATLRLDRFRLAEAPARDYESVGVPRSCELDATSLRMVALGMGILNLFAAFCQASSGTDARSGKVRCPGGNDMGRMIRCCFVDRDTF